MAFRCPRSLGIYQWKIMPFGLKNTRVTYQSTMNYIFHDYVREFVEVYIDDFVIKSSSFEVHLFDLRKMFERM